MDEIASVTAAVPLADFHARVTFSDGTERDINLLPYIDAGGVFEAIRNDERIFRSMTVENDTITWPNGADLDPEVLYYDLGPNATEEAWRAARASTEHTAHP